MALNVDVRNVRADDLRYLVALAKSGRLTAAADALGVNHTTVSRRVRALEQVLHTRLIDRGADGWELTETGRAVAEQARPIQEAVERAALAAAGGHPNALVDTIRLTTPDGFGSTFAVPALTRVQERHPNIAVELITATRQLSLHQSGFDLAIAVGKPVTTRLLTERFSEYTLALYASDEYLAEHGDPATMEEVKKHTLVFYIGSLLQVGDLDLGRLLPGMTARFASTNIFAQLEATRRGAGIGLLPKFLAVKVPELRRIQADVPPLRLSWTLAARRESVSRPAVQVVREALHREVQARQDELI